MIFRQLLDAETSTYSYILADEESREAALIDSVLEQVDRDLQCLQDLNLTLKYILETHIHADHITGASVLREKTGAKTAVAKASNVDCADLLLSDADRLQLGAVEIQVLATPGHTNSCLSYYVGDRVFTGDALLIRGCGRTDFQEGSSERLFDSVRKKLFALPDETLVFPAHDYKGLLCSSIDEEKRLNPRLNLSISKAQFVDIMKGLKLSQPKKIEQAVPRNLKCGKGEAA